VHGPDHLSALHLVNVHPTLVMHFCNLFRITLLTGLVHEDSSAAALLLKDKTGDINSLESLHNYRGITLIPVVAKLFEGVLLDICSDFW
jgi:hypothetical protein